MGEQKRHRRGKWREDIFITFCADAKSSDRPCSAEYPKWLERQHTKNSTTSNPHLGSEQVYSNSVHFKTLSKYLLLPWFLSAVWPTILKGEIR